MEAWQAADQETEGLQSLKRVPESKAQPRSTGAVHSTVCRMYKVMYRTYCTLY